jgi:4-amino-4-deoxy-L-arabinose transferase-like glycosyltransferase
VQAVETQPISTSAPPPAPQTWLRTQVLPVALILLALGLGLLGQTYLSKRLSVLDALVFYTIAVVVFVKGLAPLPMVQAALAHPRAAPLRLAVPSLVFLPLALALTTFLTAGGNQVRPVTVVCWIGAILTTLYVAADPRPDLRAWGTSVVAWLRQPRSGVEVRVPWLAVLVVGIVLLSAFYHYWQLDGVPIEMTSDHAEKFQDIQDLVDGQRPWFFPRNTGREPMQFYFTWLVALVRGVDHPTLKIVTAGAGTFVSLACFFFARQFFGNAVGLVTAFLVAISKWEVATARVGLRVPFAPLWSAITLWAFFRVLRYGGRNDYLLLGLGVGFGLYGYTPFRGVIPVYLVLALGLTLLLRWRDGMAARIDLIRNSALAVVVALVVFLPLGRYMFDFPGSFWERSASRLTSDGPAIDNPALVFLGNLKNAALMFNWQGDIVWVNMVSLDPFLDPVTGALLVFGVAYAIYRLVRAREWIYAYLLLGLPVLTLASTLAIAYPNENPSVFRALPAIPVVFVLAAIPLVLAARQIRTLLGRPGGTVLAAAVVGLALALAAFLNYQSYFEIYAEQYRRTAHNSREMGAVMRGYAQSIGDYRNAYHIAYPHWVDTRNIGTAAGQPRWNNALLSPDATRAVAAGPGPQLYIINPNDQASLAILRQLHPEGHYELRPSRAPGHDFGVYLVPPPPG